MSYEKGRRFWPTEQDMRSRSTVYWVRSSEEGVVDLVSHRFSESMSDIEDRNRRNFPIYRIVKWGQDLLKREAEVNEV